MESTQGFQQQARYAPIMSSRYLAELRAVVTRLERRQADVAIDAAGIITTWNERATAFLGFTEDEAMGKALSPLVIPERLRARHDALIREAVRTRLADMQQSKVFCQRLLVPALHKDGHERMIEVTIIGVLDEDDVHFLAFFSEPARRIEA